MSQEVCSDKKRKLPYYKSDYMMDAQQLLVSGMLKVMEDTPTKEEYLAEFSKVKDLVYPDGDCVVHMWAFGKLMEDLLYKDKPRIDIVHSLYLECTHFRFKVQEINKALALDADAGDEFLADPKNLCNEIVENILHCRNYKQSCQNWVTPPDMDALQKWNDLQSLFLLIVEDLHIHLDLDERKLSPLGKIEWPIVQAVREYTWIQKDGYEPSKWLSDLLQINSHVSQSTKCVSYADGRYALINIDQEKEHFNDPFYADLFNIFLGSSMYWALGRLVYLQRPCPAFTVHFFEKESLLYAKFSKCSKIYLCMLAKVTCLKVPEDKEGDFQNEISTFLDSKIDAYIKSSAKHMDATCDVDKPFMYNELTLEKTQLLSSKLMLSMMRLYNKSFWKKRPFDTSVLFKIAQVAMTFPGDPLYEKHKKILMYSLHSTGEMQLGDNSLWTGYGTIMGLMESVAKAPSKHRPSMIESIVTLIGWMSFHMSKKRKGFLLAMTGRPYDIDPSKISVLERACQLRLHQVVREIFHLVKSTSDSIFFDDVNVYDFENMSDETNMKVDKNITYNGMTMFEVSKNIIKNTTGNGIDVSSWKGLWEKWADFEEVNKCLFN